MAILEAVEREVLAARAALPTLTNERVDRALARALELLQPSAAPCSPRTTPTSRRPRARSTPARSTGSASTTAGSRRSPPASARPRRSRRSAASLRSWRLPNGLEVSERLIPIGVVGANFEARPNVAVDVATQVLKSGNAVVLRTGAAALGTVTVLVDRVLRPALADAGCRRSAVGLVRSADHAGAEALVSLPGVLPLVILRGSGASTAALARTAAAHGVRALAHAEGGGVLYAHEAAAPERLRRSPGEPRPPRRLQPAQPRLADSRSWPPSSPVVGTELGIEVRGDGGLPLDRPLGHEWASEPERVATITVALVGGVDEALRIANDETSGLAAAIVTEDAAAAQRFLDGYRGTAALWNATDALHRRLRAARHARDGHQRRPLPGPARARHLPRPLPAAVPDRRRRQPAPVTVVVKLGSSLVCDGSGRVRRSLLAARAADIAAIAKEARASASSPRARSRSACRCSASPAVRAGRRSCRRPPPPGRCGCNSRGRRRCAATASGSRRCCCRRATSPSAAATSTCATRCARC